jgi:hypothetical protein
MRQYHWITLLICILNTNVVNSQHHGRAIEIPESYKIAKYAVTDEKAFRLIAGTIWEVYSDRCNNITYTQPNGRLVKAVLSFMDKFYVAERMPDYLRIVKDPEISPHGFFSDKVEDYGWIHVNNLLLWNHCLVSKDGIDKKAILCNANFDYNPDNNAISNTVNDEIGVYEDPEMRFPLETLFSPYDVFFLYKSIGDAYLVGKGSRLEPTRNQDYMGWIHNINALIWDNRIAIEPNWDESAVAERKRNRIVTSIFFDPVSATMFMNGRFVYQDYIVWQNDPYEQRMEGEMLRFPVLSHQGSLLKVAIFGKMSNYSYNNGTLTNGLRISEYTRTIKEYTLTFTPFFDSSILNFEKISGNSRPQPSFILEAYTPFKTSNISQPLYKYVYMLSRLELANQISLYNEILKAKSRKDVQVVLLEKLKKHLPGKKDQDILELPLAHILPIYFELPVYHDYFPEGRLRDITRLWIIDDTPFSLFISDIEHKLEKLQTVFNQRNHPYSFSSNGITYYWILSQDLL